MSKLGRAGLNGAVEVRSADVGVSVDARAPLQKDGARSLRVLHVDDDPDIREVVAYALELDPNVTTRSCASGPEVIALAHDWRPDVILLDFKMPGMDGATVLARLRDSIDLAEIPVVFVTAVAQRPELEQMRLRSPVNVISKPFDPTNFAGQVRHFARPVETGPAAMREVFRRRLHDDRAALICHRPWLRDEIVSANALAQVREIAHRLAGACGIFGFAEIGDFAADLEGAVIDELDGAGSVDAVMHALDRLVTAVGNIDCPQKECSHSPGPA